jgi:hypothetical protein
VSTLPSRGVALVTAEQPGRGLVVLGEAGMRVLPLTGREPESNLAFAGLRQLLRPLAGARWLCRSVGSPAGSFEWQPVEDEPVVDDLSVEDAFDATSGGVADDVIGEVAHRDANVLAGPRLVVRKRDL